MERAIFEGELGGLNMPSVIINSTVYADVPSVVIPKQGGGNATFYDTTGATATNADILTGKTAFTSNGSTNGSMPNNGSTSGNITTKTGTVTIPSGYTSGGTVQISSAEQAKIIASNIKDGVTILGVSGGAMIKDTTISSDAASSAHIVSGKKAYVNGTLVTGALSTPTVSQDSTTKVLTIS